MKIYVDADACPVVRIIEKLAKKARRSSKKHHLKGPAKRTAEDDQRFEESFEKMIRKVNELNENSCDKGEASVN